MAYIYKTTYTRPSTDVEFVPPEMPVELNDQVQADLGITTEKTYSEDNLSVDVVITCPTEAAFDDWQSTMSPHWVEAFYLDWLFNNDIDVTHEVLENT